MPESVAPVEKHYTIAQVSGRLGVSRNTILRIVRGGHLKAFRFPGTTKFLVRESELLRYIGTATPVEPAEAVKMVANLPGLDD